jgi:uncharacterized protein
MSEAQNLQTIRDIYAAFGRSDIPFILSKLTDDVRWITHIDPIVPWSGDFSGKTNIPRFFDAILETCEVTAFEPQEFIVEGDKVVSLGIYGAKVKATGKSTLPRWCFIWTFRQDGLVSGYEQFHEPSMADGFRA